MGVVYPNNHRLFIRFYRYIEINSQYNSVFSVKIKCFYNFNKTKQGVVSKMNLL